MQTVSTLFTGLANGAKSMVAGGAPSSNLLGLASLGTSATSALSNYAMTRSQAAAYAMAATDEQIGSRQDFLTAQQRSNVIRQTYNRTVGAQLAETSAMGIDIGSGSVIEAQRQAQDEADRQLSVTRSTANANAAQRRSRAILLKNAADLTDMSGKVSLLTDLASAGTAFAQIGGKK